MDNLTENLEKGIEAKRQGKYTLAIDYYEKAKSISPTDKRIFSNLSEF